MQSENENVRPANETNASTVTASPNTDAGEKLPSQEIATHTPSVDSFYEKLTKLYEFSGLSLLFNFRETRLDLYMFYKEVTERGGFYQVTKDGKWDEVASTLNSRSSVSISPTQLQKLYANLLYQLEQIYHYRSPAKVATASGDPPGIGDSPRSSIGKRKYCNNSQLPTVHSADGDGPNAKRKRNDNSNQMSTGPKSAISPKLKDIKKDPNAPVRPRGAYQLFLKKECDRLKKIHGESSRIPNNLNMAINAWRRLSEIDRQLYAEESRRDRERFNRELAAYKECKSVQEGDYHVTMQPAAESFFVPDQPAVELASKLMKNAQPNDTMFQINLDGYCGSLDIPS